MTSDDVQRCNARTRNRNAQLLRRRRSNGDYVVSRISCQCEVIFSRWLGCTSYCMAETRHGLGFHWTALPAAAIESKYNCKSLKNIHRRRFRCNRKKRFKCSLCSPVPTFICHRRSIESNTFFLFSVTGEQKNADMIIAGTHMFRYFFRVTPHSRPRVDRRGLCPRDHAKEIQRKSRIGRNNNKLKEKKLTASQSNQRRTNVRYARLRAHNANGQGQPAPMRRMEMNRNEQ